MSNVIAFPGTDPIANLPAPQAWPEQTISNAATLVILSGSTLLVGTAIVEANRAEPARSCTVVAGRSRRG